MFNVNEIRIDSFEIRIAQFCVSIICDKGYMHAFHFDFKALTLPYLDFKKSISTIRKL